MHDDERRILINARTAVNHVMVKPMHERIAADPRVQCFFMASEEPPRATAILRDAGRCVAPLYEAIDLPAPGRLTRQEAPGALHSTPDVRHSAASCHPAPGAPVPRWQP